jgi:(1->4)-alpha-D-glucan 1-alpha-D-glucosylmutase
VDGAGTPEPEIEWLFYQALAGAWPADLRPDDGDGVATLSGRMAAYMEKVIREAKLRTSWTSPAAAYEAAVAAFVLGAFESAAFLADFHRRIQPLIVAGAANSLSQLAIKLAAPGVPDIYQGTELWDLSLVDPDNRRPVDFDARAALLSGMADTNSQDSMTDWLSGRPKLRLLARGLAFRRERSALFHEGDYVPLSTRGAHREKIVAFVRRHDDDWLVAIAPRLVMPLVAGCGSPLVPVERWEDTAVTLPDAAAHLHWRDIVTDALFAPAPSILPAQALARFPVALWTSTRR